MAHGGHAGGHCHTHYHNTGENHNESCSPFELFLCIAIIALVVILVIYAGLTEESIGNKEPISGVYELYPDYVLDDTGYLSNHDNIVSGLEYLQSKTNIQMVVLVSNRFWSDSKAVERYYELFNDEGHVLLIIPTNWTSSTKYYAIGDIADNVIGDKQMSYLINKIGNTKDGKKWEQILTDFADVLISNN